MRKSISASAKKGPGRPVTTGTGQTIGVRMLEDRLSALDEWIAQQSEPGISRPEAIRRLVELGLKRDGTLKAKSAPKAASSRAEDLAARVIDSRMPADATTEERDTRKRRLVKGPSSFLSVRKDHPK